MRAGSNIYRTAEKYLRSVISNLELTINYVGMGKYCGYLVVDGTYLLVSGSRRKAVLIWGIDYQTHDIPHYIIAPSENYQAMAAYFKRLRMTGYELRYLVCDDNEGIKMAARYIYPKVIIQTCLKHYREAIKRDLGLKVNDYYLEFYMRLESIFITRLTWWEILPEIAKIHNRFGGDPRCEYWLTDIMQRREELTAYHNFEDAPNTTNLIEAYNSHLKARLKSIRGFKTLRTAKLWINGYIVKRRLSNFTSCGRKFKHLNGTCSLQNVLKTGQKLPKIF